MQLLKWSNSGGSCLLTVKKQIISNDSVPIVREEQKKTNQTKHKTLQNFTIFSVTLKHHYYFNLAHIKNVQFSDYFNWIPILNLKQYGKSTSDENDWMDGVFFWLSQQILMLLSKFLFC